MRAPASIRERCKLVVDRASHARTPMVEVRQCLRTLARMEAQYSGVLDAEALTRMEVAQVRVGASDVMQRVHAELLAEYEISARDALQSTTQPWAMDSKHQLLCIDEMEWLERALIEAMERHHATKRAVRLSAHHHGVARARYDTLLLYTHKYATAMNEWATTTARRRVNASKRESMRKMLLNEQYKLAEFDANDAYAKQERERTSVELRILRAETSAWFEQVCKPFDAHVGQRMALDRLRQMIPNVSVLPW